jgi:hypothetical protein
MKLNRIAVAGIIFGGTFEGRHETYAVEVAKHS